MSFPSALRYERTRFSAWSGKRLLILALLLLVLSQTIPLTAQPDVVSLPQIQSAYRWRAELTLGDARLPWIFYWDGGDTAWTQDGPEWVPLQVSQSDGGSYTLSWPVYTTYLSVDKAGATLSGTFRDATRDAGFALEFHAERSQAPLFSGASADPSKVLPFLGRDWTVTFLDGQGETPAAGRFERNSDGSVSGTFLTPTGDYRFLQGAVVEDTLHLGVMDGSHLFLFRATAQPDGSLLGEFRSGSSYKAAWTAHRNPDGYRQDPDQLTKLKENKAAFGFCFPDLEGVQRCLDDPQWAGKVRIVQVMGSWCPNCLDETRFLLEQQARWPSGTFQVISLAFERGSQAGQWVTGPSRLAAALDIPWPILLAGPADKRSASLALPALEAVLAYPTTIFVDKQGNIARIHTGFNGPATGQDFANFAESFDRTIRELSGLEPLKKERP